MTLQGSWLKRVREKLSPTTPPPPRRDSFAALTIDVTSRLVIDVRMRDTLLFRAEEGCGTDVVDEADCRREDLYRSEIVGIEERCMISVDILEYG